MQSFLSTGATLEMKMFYLDIYAYDAPQEEQELASKSQVIVLFWMFAGAFMAYLIGRFVHRRRKKLLHFVAGLLMPS